MVEHPGQRVLIVGYGTAGQAIAADAASSGKTVVGFLDDFRTDEPVLGLLSDVNAVVENTEADVIYFAIPSLSAAKLREFVSQIRNDGLEVLMVPRTYEVLSRETVAIDDLTDVDVLDLVGREPVKHDLLRAREFIQDKTILVTGAAGSIGSCLVRQLLTMSPAKVVCVDWWENGVFYLQQSLTDYKNVTFHIADVKNSTRLASILNEHRPDVVFHAAAYKHVPLMQDNPTEAIANNAWGSLNVMKLANDAGVANFVYVSTDKAVNPANIMGASKRLGEILMERLSHDPTITTRYNAVRFGNVIQSNGSVMQTFRKQIAAKQPLTVTHKDVTRYFMTLDEAAQLVIQAALVADPGQICVLDMGEPVKIMDLATSLAKAVGHKAGVEIIGLRPGEKLYEELSYEPDKVTQTSNPKIYITHDADHRYSEARLATIDDLVTRARDNELHPADVFTTLTSLKFPLK